MKTLIYFFIFFTYSTFSQNMNYAEIRIDNKCGGSINIYLTPVGCVFSGAKFYPNYPNYQYTYSFMRCRQEFIPPGNWNYIVGSTRNYLNVQYSDYRYVDFDDGVYCTVSNNVIGGFSFGLWKLEFTNYPTEDTELEWLEDCFIDYRDENFGWYGTGFANDIAFELRRVNNQNELWFKFIGGDWVNIYDSRIQNKTIKIWHQVGRSGDPVFPGSPNLGNFKTSNLNGGIGLNFLDFPLISTISPFNGVKHDIPNECGMNLSVQPGHTANILSTKTFIITNNSTFSLLQNSILNFQTNSTLLIKNGSKFCSYGGIITGSPRIVYDKRGLFSHCIFFSGPFRNGDIIVEDSAIVEFPDSTVITFDSTSQLIMKPHSELRMGRYSKIVFENGSRIKCDNAKFTSLDSTQTWDGIYLDGIAFDTLKNCTFQNAVNGINITDNYNPFGSPGAVEISNCTFKNSTSSDLLNYVYVNNSYNVLVKGCNAEKTGSGGFTSGIIAEYCPANGVVIADNNINYVTTGISLLQSSVYTGRNTITGSTNSGTGIYLDNSNGTIEHNTVNNFQKSVYGSYSSPYMLKNTLNNAYINNIELVSNSYPVMKPVVSGSTLRWLGGNNTVTGYPANSGIAFADCYPLMDSGYNRITVNGSDYMNGIFTFAYTTVYSRINYWYDNPPNSSLFDISGGNADYSNPFNGTTLPSTDGAELNSIGWGMYDTVYTKSLGDNSTPEDLFMQAYTEEMSQNYSDAITHYREVVNSYKTSSYAHVSLSRIFNCLEKSQAIITDYQAIQTYYNSIKSNTAYPTESRELAEDFVIKSKVKQGSIEEALNDYSAIYLLNLNNSKGLHALLNRLCLENMIQGDNSSNSTNYENHKIIILSLITGEKINTGRISNNTLPEEFRLMQNYPNPFNPVTNIKFQIPLLRGVSEGGGVLTQIRIYDVTGREVFSYSDTKQPGTYEIQFDGTNLASGLYFYSLEVGNPGSGRMFKDTKKMVLLK